MARYLPALTSQDLDVLSQGAMFMTEQAAGSDVGATAVRAAAARRRHLAAVRRQVVLLQRRRRPGDGAGAAGRARRRAPKGLSLFLLPRVLPDGRRNAYRIVRLKDKLGTRSMASGEITLQGATAYLVGEPGAGFRQMADMINNSRLSNGVRAAGLMRRAVTEALFVAHRRVAFGRRLMELPLMRRQLLKMLVRAEQARSMMLQTAEALRRSDAGEPGAYALLRHPDAVDQVPCLPRCPRGGGRRDGGARRLRLHRGMARPAHPARRASRARSGKAPATSWRWTCGGRRGGRTRWRHCATHVTALLDDAPPLADARAALDRACALMDTAQAEGGEVLARQAASALYHVTSAAAMAWEAGRLQDPHRLALARMVLVHRVLPRDPLRADVGPDGVVEDGAEDGAAEDGTVAALLSDPGRTLLL